MEYQFLFFSASALFDPGQSDLVIEDSELVLPVLAKKGYRMVMIANGTAQILRGYLARWPFAAHLERVVISEEVGVAKPDPAIFDLAMRAVENRDKNSVMMIGADLIDDIQGGSDYGIETCWWNPTGLDAGRVETHNEMLCYEQLLDLV